MKSILISLLISFSFVPVSAATTISSEEFLKAISGDFRGRGSLLIGTSTKQERVACSLKNELTEAMSELSVRGICATTQGKISVEGSLKLDSANQINGNFLSVTDDAVVTKTDSLLTDNLLTISISSKNKETSVISKTRQTIKPDESGGFLSLFYKFDEATSSYLEIGSVKFSSRK